MVALIEELGEDQIRAENEKARPFLERLMRRGG
jgi:hypothetical protein